jgi:hypothetical protein
MSHLALTFRNYHVPAIQAERAPRDPSAASTGNARGRDRTAWASATGGADTAAVVAGNKIADEEAALRRW